MWTNPGFSRDEKKNGLGEKKNWQHINVEPDLNFSFYLFVSSVRFPFGVCVRNFIYTHNYQYDIKST